LGRSIEIEIEGALIGRCTQIQLLLSDFENDETPAAAIRPPALHPLRPLK